MKKKQTAVEWLQERYNECPKYEEQIYEQDWEQAKEMEKEQLLDMGYQFAIMGEDSPLEYYTETYGGDK
jgi:hypothetical protein